MIDSVQRRAHVNRYTDSYTEVVRQQELHRKYVQEQERLKAQRLHVEHLDKIRDRETEKGRYVDVKV
jgi:DNA transposition AAA+ family ATPase